MLKKMFDMQKKLNDYIYKKQGVTANDGRILTTDYLISVGNFGFGKDHIPNPGANSDTNKWLRNHLEALEDESRELKDELLWKYWSKDTLDMQNIRVEIVDQFHFLMTLAMDAGMDADEVFRIYEQKNKVNLERQDKGYNKASKTEDDNKGIK